MIKPLFIALGFLGLHCYVYYFFATGEVLPARKEFRDFPLTLHEWRCSGLERMGADIEANLGVSDYLICTYRNDALRKEVGVYLGYHESQVRSGGGGGGGSMKERVIHTPKHCLPGSGWDIIQADARPLDLDGLPERPAEINRFIIAKENDRQVVYYWYQSQGRVTDKDWLKAIYLFWDRATRHRTDGALIRFTVPMDKNTTPEESDAVFESLAREMLPLLNEYIPK